MKKGFTIIELLIVISIIGILAGVIMTVINPETQRDRARDAVKMETLRKLVQPLESYTATQNCAPIDLDGNRKIEEGTDGDWGQLSVFLNVWPADYDGAAYEYTRYGCQDYMISIPKSSDTGRVYKYDTAWGEIRDCLLANRFSSGQCNEE